MENPGFNFLSVLLIQCFIGCLAASNLTTDQSALLEFKDSLNPNTVLANNWTTSTSVCNWVGVSCSSNPERVTSLDLHDMNLTGTVSAHLGNLSSLISLDLSGNDFRSYLPSTIYNLSSLQTIDLTSCGLSGDLPDDLCHYFPKLEVLRFDFNEFSGSVPSSLGDCTNLQNLSLSSNRFNGFIPRSIGNLTMLKEVHLGGNSLQGEIPWEIGNLLNLEIFAAENNRGLTGGIPPSMFNISSLTKLILFNNSLSGGLPDDMCNHLSKLEVLHLSLNDFTGHIPSSIGECSNLQNLSLSVNRFNGTIPRSIGNLTSLKRLSLRENDLTGEIPWEIGNLYSLEILAVQHMRLTGPIPPSIFNISSLVEISLNNNSLSALEYLHFGCSVPVIHCDLKPSNILLDRDMVAHVGDFGIAKLLEEEDSTKQTMTLATFGYMAPEYGSRGIVSLKGDVYSYGILLMETFTRRKPTDEIFSGEMSLVDWVKKSLSDAITDVLDANLLREEEHFIGKVDCISSIMKLALECTEKSPEERKNMKDVVAILKKIKIKFLKDVEQA